MVFCPAVAFNSCIPFWSCHCARWTSDAEKLHRHTVWASPLQHLLQCCCPTSQPCTVLLPALCICCAFIHCICHWLMNDC